MAMTMPMTVAGQLSICTSIPIFIPIIRLANRDTGIAYGKEQSHAEIIFSAMQALYTFVVRSCGTYFNPNSKAPNNIVT